MHCRAHFLSDKINEELGDRARAYMKWKGVLFKELLASSDIFKTIVKPKAKINMILVLLIPQGSEEFGFRVIQDTKEIIGNVLEMGRRYQRQEKLLQFDFANAATGGDASLDELMAIGEKAGARFKALCRILGIIPVTIPIINRQFHELIHLMSFHFEKYPFLLGNVITLVDIGHIGTFYTHLGRDPVPDFIIKTEAPLVFEWIERVTGHAVWANKDRVRWNQEEKTWETTYGMLRNSARPSELEDDEVPETTLNIARLLLNDYLPVLRDTLKRTAEYISKKNLGAHTFSLHAGNEEVRSDRNLDVHAMWMFQRINDRTYSMYQYPEQRQACDKWLKDVGDRQRAIAFVQHYTLN
ncbi:hypothetical protein BDZ91DRAFT_778807 [Kalaharituber pfeilii]|nr:hypothetical protein BDZ91DRAFT_778807 [Kalaharituber pfeilii]